MQHGSCKGNVLCVGAQLCREAVCSSLLRGLQCRHGEGGGGSGVSVEISLLPLTMTLTEMHCAHVQQYITVLC
jgi:hypothetical protein